MSVVYLDMDLLKEDFVYSITEAERLTGINRKRIERRAKKLNVKKEGRSYVITGKWLVEQFDIVVDKAPESVATTEKDVSYTRKVRELEYRIQELEQELLGFEVGPNERLEVFTNEEYDVFRQRLIEWTTQQNDLIKAQEFFDTEKASLQELITHYKTQFDYQRKQSDKILKMHSKLIKTIQKQSTIQLQRNVIEARDKRVIDDDWNINTDS